MEFDSTSAGVYLNEPYPERSKAVLASIAQSVSHDDFLNVDSVDDALKSTHFLFMILDARCKLEHKHVALLSRCLMSALQRPSLFHLPLQTKILTCLSILWRRFRRCTTLDPVDWRVLYQLLKDVHIVMDPKPSFAGSSVLRGHRESLIKAIARGKRFFSPGSAQDIMEMLWSKGESPHNLSYHINFLVVHLFMPIDSTCASWLPKLMEQAMNIDPSSKVVTCLLSILSRAAKKDYFTRTINFEQYLSLCFHWFIQHLPLSVDGVTGAADARCSQKLWPKELDWALPHNTLSKYMAKFVVYNIRSESQQAIFLLQNFFQSTSTFFHPSNAGAWTAPLADFLSFTSRYFSKLYWNLNSDTKVELANKFYECVFPIANDAVYSRSTNMVMCAQDCLKHLGYILPYKMFPQLIADAKMNLGSVSESNRTLTSLGLLSGICHPLFDRRIYPAGAEHLNSILWAALDCFDGINLLKSVSALSFFGMIFYIIPLIDGKDKMTESEEEEEARHATVGFPEWSSAFLEKLCNVLKHFDAVEKSSHRDQGLTRILYRTCRPFFCSLSLSSHQSCVQFLKAFFVDNTQLKSRKYLGIIARVAALGYAEQTFHLLTLPLLHQIVGPDTNPEVMKTAFNSLASEEHEWFLYLAACSIRESGGSHLVSYVDYITTISCIAFCSSNKSVRKMGRKLMRYTLAALTSVYPLEFRPYSPSAWQSPTFKHWQCWGEFVEHFKSDPDGHKTVIWHHPMQEEIDAAQKACTSVISSSGTPLFGDLTSLSVEEIINYLMNIRALLEGCLSVAGNFSGEVVHKLFHSITVDPIRTFEPFVLKIGEVSLRDWFTRVVLRVSSHFRDSELKIQSAKPEVWIVLISISNKLLNDVVISEDSLEQAATSNRYAIRSQREFESGKRCIMRALLVEQSFIRYLRSFHLCRHFLAHTSQVAELIDFVNWACLLDFQSVRTLSAGALSQACETRHFIRTRIATSFTDVIRLRHISEKTVLGAIECLRNRHILSWVSNSWSLTLSVMMAICDSSHHQDDIVQSAIIEFFNAFTDRLHLLPIHLPADLQTYQLLCQQLLEVLINSEGKSPHWRSQLAAARFLLHSIRNDIPPSLQHLQFFWNNCISDFVPLRRICISALVNIFTLFPPSSEAAIKFSEISTMAPSSAVLSDSDSGLFYDSNSSGWTPGSKCIAFRYSEPSKLSAAVSSDWNAYYQTLFTSEFLKKFITALEEDHSKSNSSSGNSSKGRTGAGDQIAASVHGLMQNRLCWPKTTFLSVHDAMMFDHVLLLKGLCLHCPHLIDGLLNSALELLTRNQSAHSFRDAHVSAAEIFAGVGGSSKYWQSNLQERHCVLLSKLLIQGLDKCPSDVVKDWSSAIRFVCTDMDPKRLHWLVPAVVDEALSDNSPSQTPSQTTKRLLFLQAVMVEFAWRAPLLNGNVSLKLSSNSSLLISPFTQVRQEVARVLCFVLRNNYRPGFSSCSNCSVDTIVCFYENLLKPTAHHDYQDSEPGSIPLLETVIYWVSFCCTIGEPCYTSDIIIRLVPFVISACHHPNAETAALAKYCLVSVAWSNFDVSVLERLMDICTAIIDNDSISFHSHLAAITFFSSLVIRHLFKLDVLKVKSILATHEKLLGSARIECREISSKLLTGFLSCAQSLISIKRFSRKFMSEAKSPSSLTSKHGAILALAALIRSEPYRVPEWMPEVLAFCAAFIYEPSPIGGTVQKLFTEFKRTHQDTWHIDKEKFTEEQLTAVNEATIAPSYFA